VVLSHFERTYGLVAVGSEARVSAEGQEDEDNSSLLNGKAKMLVSGIERKARG